jgi:hypothetical protein
VTSAPAEILLVAVNARFSHCAFAARSLAANLGPLAACARILETDLDISPLQLATQVAEARPRVAGFSVYLWNVRLIEAAARILRAVAPDIRLVAGGPELTPGYAQAGLFDAVIIGEGESAFRAFCERTLESGAAPASPAQPLLHTPPPEDPATLALPYSLYTDADLAQRTVYVESSRGCPYPCGYCTSAGTGLRLFPLERLLPAFGALWRRGLRRFKFLDRTFNAHAAHACAVLDFFLGRVTPDTRLHFEINADRLQDEVAARIAAFPAGALHLEAGIQTLIPAVAAAAGRSPDTARTLAALRFLTRETGAAVHADLIFGLPGETEDSFARGFNELVAACDPPELQVNLLKGLPGTRFAREADRLGLVFSAEPPYELLRSDAMDFGALARLQRVARTWELVHNRGRFPRAVRALRDAAAGDLFASYRRLAERLHAEEGKLFAIGLPRLAHHLRAHLAECGASADEAARLVAADLNARPL